MPSDRASSLQLCASLELVLRLGRVVWSFLTMFAEQIRSLRLLVIHLPSQAWLLPSSQASSLSVCTRLIRAFSQGLGLHTRRSPLSLLSTQNILGWTLGNRVLPSVGPISLLLLKETVPEHQYSCPPPTPLFLLMAFPALSLDHFFHLVTALVTQRLLSLKQFVGETIGVTVGEIVGVCFCLPLPLSGFPLCYISTAPNGLILTLLHLPEPCFQIRPPKEELKHWLGVGREGYNSIHNTLVVPVQIPGTQEREQNVHCCFKPFHVR